MLVQDTLTGAVHEIPQSQLYEADYGGKPGTDGGGPDSL